MVIAETIEINGKQFKHHYSDANKYLVRNDGTVFTDAIDILDSEYSYIEGEDMEEIESEI